MSVSFYMGLLLIAVIGFCSKKIGFEKVRLCKLSQIFEYDVDFVAIDVGMS